MGRKDTQVKIRGNRLELGEVECHVRDFMPGVTRVVAEAFLPVGSKVDYVLAAFLENSRAASISSDTGPAAPEARILNIKKDVEAELAKNLPAYMIPTLFFTIPELPLTLTGKTNRKRLREIAASFPVQQALMQTATHGRRKPPRTEAEQELQKLWVRVLKVGGDSIKIDDNFFRLGGDSIVAMKLVGEARNVGIKLTVADVFRQPTLAGLSSLESADRGQLHEETLTTSLLDSGFKGSFPLRDRLF